MTTKHTFPYVSYLTKYAMQHISNNIKLTLSTHTGSNLAEKENNNINERIRKKLVI